LTAQGHAHTDWTRPANVGVALSCQSN